MDPATILTIMTTLAAIIGGITTLIQTLSKRKVKAECNNVKSVVLGLSKGVAKAIQEGAVEKVKLLDDFIKPALRRLPKASDGVTMLLFANRLMAGMGTKTKN